MKMMIKKGKIGSALAAFESNISKNEQYGASSKSFVSGIASPRKFRIGPAPRSPCEAQESLDKRNEKSVEGDQSPTYSMTEDDDDDDAFTSVQPKSPIIKRAGFGMLPIKMKGISSPAADLGNSVVENRNFAQVKHSQSEEQKKDKQEGSCIRDPVSEDARADSLSSRQLPPVPRIDDGISPKTSKVAITRDTRSLAPLRPEGQLNSFDHDSQPSTPNTDLTAGRKGTSSVSPARSRSPSSRARNAIRNQISLSRSPMSAPMAPQRKISDPDNLPTSGQPVAQRAQAFENRAQQKPDIPLLPPPPPPLKNPKKRQKNLIAARTGKFDVELKKKKAEELREQARQYDPAKHGLKGILKWDTKSHRPRRRRIRWAEVLTDHSVSCHSRRRDRRTSLEFTMGTHSASKDQLKQPRRHSMSDFDSTRTKADPPSFLLNENKRINDNTLLLTALETNLSLAGIQLRKFRAACRLQAIVRRFIVRLRMPIFRLEHQLRVIDRQRVSDLNQIQEKKWRRMETARAKADARIKRQESKLEMSQELVKGLRDQNSRLETKARDYENNSKLLKKMNEQLETSTKQLVNNVAVLGDSLDILKNHNDMLKLQCEELETTIREVHDRRDEAEQNYRLEQQVKDEMEQVLRSIVMTISIRCADTNLVHEVKTLHAVLIAEGKQLSAEKYLDSSSSTFGDYISRCDEFSVLSSTSRPSLSASSRCIDIDACSFASMDEDDDVLTMCTADSFGL